MNFRSGLSSHITLLKSLLFSLILSNQAILNTIIQDFHKPAISETPMTWYAQISDTTWAVCGILSLTCNFKTGREWLRRWECLPLGMQVLLKVKGSNLDTVPCVLFRPACKRRANWHHNGSLALKALKAFLSPLHWQVKPCDFNQLQLTLFTVNIGWNQNHIDRWTLTHK